jgi:hypothetical protein
MKRIALVALFAILAAPLASAEVATQNDLNRLPALEVGQPLPIAWLDQFKDQGLRQWVQAHVVVQRQLLSYDKYGISATDQIVITPEVFNELADNQRVNLLAFELGKVFYSQVIAGTPSRMGIMNGFLREDMEAMKVAEYGGWNLHELGDPVYEGASGFGYVFRVAILKVPSGNASWYTTLKSFAALIDPVLTKEEVDRATNDSNDDVLGSTSTEAVRSRESIQAEWTDYENWLRQLKETLAHQEAVRLQEREQAEFRQALYTYASAFGYLAAAAGMACDNPDALLAEVRQGRYSNVGMDRKYLTVYLGMVSPRKGVSLCQFQILNKINDSEKPVSWRDLEAWGSQYRAEHPTFLQRTGRALNGFRDSLRHFAEAPSGSGGSHTENQGGTDHSQHAPDVMGTSSARQLRGIASTGWN